MDPTISRDLQRHDKSILDLSDQELEAVKFNGAQIGHASMKGMSVDAGKELDCVVLRLDCQRIIMDEETLQSVHQLSKFVVIVDGYKSEMTSDPTVLLAISFFALATSRARLTGNTPTSVPSSDNAVSFGIDMRACSAECLVCPPISDGTRR